MLDDTGTGWSGSRTGRTDRLTARVPHQVEGSAIGTSSRRRGLDASRARRRAAAARSAGAHLRVGDVAAQLGHHPGQRQGAGRPTLDRHSTVTPSSSRNRDGWSPSSSREATAVTTSRSRARVQAT